MKISAYTVGRDNNFNLIRLTAAIVVLISHSFPIVLGSNDHEPLRAMSLKVTFGELAVNVFFVTSGFLVFASLHRTDNLLQFGVARALRVFPGLLVMLVIVVLGLGPLLSKLAVAEYLSHPKTLKYVILNATLLPSLIVGGQDWLPGLFTDNPFKNAVNGSLWTLPIEAALYVGLGGIWILSRFAICRRIEFLTLSVLAAALLLLAIALIVHFKGEKWYGKAAEMGYMYFFGAALYIFRDRISLTAPAAYSAIAVVFLSAYLDATLFFFAYLALLPYILMYLAYVPAGAVRTFNKLGDYSYGIYIYAFPIQQTVMMLMPATSVFQLILISGALTLILAVGSWHLVESRALLFKKKTPAIARVD